MITQNTDKIVGLDRDILEWNILEEVLAVLLKDRSTGRNLIWATDDYAERGYANWGFQNDRRMLSDGSRSTAI